MFCNTRAILPLVAVFAAHADVTLRYKSDIQWNPGLPQQMIEQTMKTAGSALQAESVVQIRADKGYSSHGGLRSIVDVQKQEVTSIDAEKQRYSTNTVKEYADQAAKAIGQLPPEARAAMGMMKVTSDSRMTGRAATIQGVETEEREVTMSIEGPPVPNMPPGPMVRMVLQFWTAKTGQESNVPALAEVKAFRIWDYAAFNPASTLNGMFQQMPGMGEGLQKFIDDLQKSNSVVMRARVAMYMPSVIAMLKQLPPDRNPLGANLDPDAPMMQMNQELVEFSTAAIPDSVFQVPSGYKAVPLSDILGDFMARFKPKPQPQQ